MYVYLYIYTVRDKKFPEKLHHWEHRSEGNQDKHKQPTHTTGTKQRYRNKGEHLFKKSRNLKEPRKNKRITGSSKTRGTRQRERGKEKERKRKREKKRNERREERQ